MMRFWCNMLRSVDRDSRRVAAATRSATGWKDIGTYELRTAFDLTSLGRFAAQCRAFGLPVLRTAR
ncbi:hypothetical protein BRAS3843_1720005 [Bradyrhizobium sp. STM 3843]|nr:hypothetical protein BRAS3843_1720005 [Bradyrhizobium sp. STM 3843]